MTDPEDDATDGDADDDQDSHDSTHSERDDGDGADRGDRDASGGGVEREDGFQHEDVVEREDGFEYENAIEREATVERDDGLVHDGREEGIEATDPTGEPRHSSGEDLGDPPQSFEPGAEHSDELPHSSRSSRSELVGTEPTDGPSAHGENADDTTTHAGLARARKVGTVLDDAVTIPGTSVRIGLDPILGILPGGGDAVAAVGSLYIVLEAARAGVSRANLKKMLALVAVDLVAGSVPLIGVLFDAVWKANKWNVATFEEHVHDDAR